MPHVSPQELAVMNAEMAARIFMHIAQDSPGQTKTYPARLTLTQDEQQALSDISGAADPAFPPPAPELDRPDA